MKPLKLKFSGVNSFSESAEIDFGALSQNGIFGIFGETGSGKSTILDCINFALYGNVERSKEKTDIINYKCYVAEVTFSFALQTAGKNCVYTVKRSIKKDKNGTHKAELYADDGEKEVCIADKASAVESKIVEILGVNAEDFRKCIALPQGEFAQFVKSAPRERLALIERLFDLSRYGDRLKDKIARLQTETENKYQNVSGRLEGFGGVSEEVLKEISSGLENKEKEIKELSKMAEAAEKECERLKKLGEKKSELNENKKRAEELAAQKPEMEALRQNLSVLPVCAELSRASDEKTKISKELDGVKKEIAAESGRCAAEECRLEVAQKALKDGDFDKKIEECTALEAKYKLSEGKPEKYKKLQSELILKRGEYAELLSVNKKLTAEKEAFGKTLKTAEDALKKYSGIKTEDLINDDFKGALLKGEFVNELGWFANFRGDIRMYKDGSPLYLYAEERVSGKIKEYEEKISALRDFDIKAVNEQLEAVKENRETQQKLQSDLDKKREYYQGLSAKIAVNEKELATAMKEGADVKARINELKEELCGLFGENCTDYEGAKTENKERLLSLTEKKKQLSDSAERARESLNGIKISLGRLGVLERTAQKSFADADEKVKELLIKSGFASVDECKKFLGEFSGGGEKTLEEYDAKVVATAARIAELEAVEGVAELKPGEVGLAVEKKRALDADLKTAAGESAVLKSRLLDISERLSEKKKLEKEFELIAKQRNLILKLKEVTKNNKFLEYIATEYLTDISALASQTLLKLTDGRYYLMYAENNFQVSDNYDGGKPRGVNTLSGGETFLVSLSLALALSQTICARSEKSIEFFFLDEGFGTLDNNLLDVVMNALDKLKSSHFTIGVISHVEELKHRIPSKITVNKATETHGSTVNLTC